MENLSVRCYFESLAVSYQLTNTRENFYVWINFIDEFCEEIFVGYDRNETVLVAILHA